MGKQSHKRVRPVRSSGAERVGDAAFDRMVQGILDAGVVELVGYGWPLDAAVLKVGELWSELAPGTTSSDQFIRVWRPEIERIRDAPPT